MCRVFAGRNDAIVAGAAAANDLGMIDEQYGHEYGRAVAVLTDVRRQDVGRILANGFGTVVTVDAIGRYQAVVKRGRQPAGGGMAVVAGVTALNMRGLFADRRHAVVTGSTAADDLGVIDGHYGRENIGRMTILAHVR